MSETTNGKGSFGQFSDRYRDRWAALHPKAAPAVDSTPIPLSDYRQPAAAEPEEMAEGTPGSAPPRALRPEVKTEVIPFGRRRVRPG